VYNSCPGRSFNYGTISANAGSIPLHCLTARCHALLLRLHLSDARSDVRASSVDDHLLYFDAVRSLRLRAGQLQLRLGASQH
jgi:hypothetical protein